MAVTVIDTNNKLIRFTQEINRRDMLARVQDLPRARSIHFSSNWTLIDGVRTTKQNLNI
jgi:hypothetical protein